jgi:hypothetical protein
MTDEERLEEAARALHEHRYGAADNDPLHWAVSRRAALLAKEALA